MTKIFALDVEHVVLYAQSIVLPLKRIYSAISTQLLTKMTASIVAAANQFALFRDPLMNLGSGWKHGLLIRLIQMYVFTGHPVGCSRLFRDGLFQRVDRFLLAGLTSSCS